MSFAGGMQQVIDGDTRRPNLRDFQSILEVLADAHARSTNGAADPAWVRAGLQVAGTKITALRHMVHARNSHRARLLDLGAQVGSMAAYASHLGFAVDALDLEPDASRFAPALGGMGIRYRSCDVSSGPLPFEDGSFDFVTYLDVLEHHHRSPKPALREIYRVLVPGGHLIISTPNHASIFNRVSLLIGRSVNDNFTYFFDGCAGNNPYPGHHREYTVRELRSALERTDFKVLQCRTTDESPAALMLYARKHPSPRIFAEILMSSMGRFATAARVSWGRILLAIAERPE